MKLFSITVILMALSYGEAFSQAGSAGFQILRLGYSARDLSLSGSADVLTHEPIAVFINPAGLATGQGTHGMGLDFMLTHRTYIAGTTIDMFGTRFDAGGIAFGTSLLLASVPDIQVRTVPGDPQSTFAAKDFVWGGGLARRFGKVDVGVSAMFLYEKLFVYESSGFAFNGGIQYSPVENVDLGISAGNIGSASAMISESISLPTFVRAGGSYTQHIGENLAVTGFAGVTSFKSGGTAAGVGAELDYSTYLRLRAGYSNGNDISGISFGAGICYNFLRFDYSYMPLKLDFGNSQTFTLSFVL